MSVSAPELAPYLERDEKALWQGAPPTGIMFRAHDVFLIPFTLLWLGFALFWEASVLGMWSDRPRSPPLFFPLFGLVFVCIGLYMAFGRFVWDALVRRGTLYALTNRRAIILTRSPFKSFRSLGLTATTEISTEEQADGSGTIFVGARPAVPYAVRGWPGLAMGGEFSFEKVQGVRDAIKIIRQIQSAAK
jgi:hypothetical protein